MIRIYNTKIPSYCQKKNKKQQQQKPGEKILTTATLQCIAVQCSAFYSTLFDSFTKLTYLFYGHVFPVILVGYSPVHDK